LKKKYVFIGDTDSINTELILKSHNKLKNKVKYILIGRSQELSKDLDKLSTNLCINEINDPLNFQDYDQNLINVFNIENISKDKYKNLLNQIHFSNYLSNSTKNDLITLPINKSVFKKKITFNGMTEYLAKINKSKTSMLMHGEKFSIIPLTTHINVTKINKYLKKEFIEKEIIKILSQIRRNIYKLDFKEINFLCYNPHCSEYDTLGDEDKIIRNTIYKYKKINGPYPADSAFIKLNSKKLFISMYHDQALIPFKILNKKGVNLTMGLDYRRLSPGPCTAKDIKFKDIAAISSYMARMLF